MFAERYIEYFNIKNLRTIQKAEQFFKDVKIKIDEGKIDIEDTFLLIIKKICYSIVVEDIEKYGEKEFEQKIQDNEDSNKNSFSHNFYIMIKDEFHLRVGQYYLKELRGDVFDSIIKMLADYYENNNGFDIECIEVGIDSSVFFKKTQKVLETLIDNVIDKDIQIDETHIMFSLENKKLKEYMPSIFILLEEKRFEKYLSSIKQFESRGDYNNAYLTIKAISERTWNRIEENKFGELLHKEALPFGSISEEHWRLFKELKDLFTQTDGRRKLWVEYIQSAKKDYKDDKAFLNRIRSIEE